jgi:sterol desaturase/sphingolipid hydroxylase (fatty acid hydroxylase superfamily)
VGTRQRESLPPQQGHRVIGYTFILSIVALQIAELFKPRQQTTALSRRRWLGNLSLFALSSIISMIPLAGALAAAAGDQRGVFGLLEVPPWLCLVLGVLLIDLWSYASHRVQHAIGFLWRFHAVHHSDPELDVTTTVRQHPVAMIIDVIATAGIVVLVGIPATAILVHRTAEAVVQTLAHANLALPAFISRFVVTPTFHRLHHSPEMFETNSNYGQVLAVWDHLFGTARKPRATPEQLGLEDFGSVRDQDPHWLLMQPFRPRNRVGLPEPVTPESASPEPATPEPAIPEPATPEPATLASN